MTDASNNSNPQDLLTILVEHNLISPAQAQLVQTDTEVTGMLTEDVLLARRWITPEALFEVAPWLKKDNRKPPQSILDREAYKANRKKYRELTNQILDENLD